jgi:hypothetical protein
MPTRLTALSKRYSPKLFLEWEVERRSNLVIRIQQLQGIHVSSQVLTIFLDLIGEVTLGVSAFDLSCLKVDHPAYRVFDKCAIDLQSLRDTIQNSGNREFRDCVLVRR